MTLKDLYKTVSRLCFDTSPSFDELFNICARRALEETYSALEVKSEARLFVSGDIPDTRIGEFHHKGGGVDTLPLLGRAYSMRLFGEGTLTVIDGDERYFHTFNCQGERICGFLKHGGKLQLEGEFSYTVRDLVTYNEIFSDDKNKIPDGAPRTVIDLGEVIPDFSAAYSLPTDPLGNEIDAFVRGRSLIIDSRYSGEVRIVYFKKPRDPFGESTDRDLDLPDEYSGILAYLVASYVLLEDNPSLSERYRNLFIDECARIKRMTRCECSGSRVKTNGWA